MTWWTACPLCPRMAPIGDGPDGVLEIHAPHPALRVVCPGSGLSIMQAREQARERDQR